ncbi:hypothetical protein QFC22_001370 [Naganishia vaughanmartiniae]|uniref:Uncharacterized protein n=1 Tax=Naganishia vaughanmartiniae TaxID=1424756 RepID=A0ACC2XIT5_9TREE|nr:hypothetical protein QFC22_001370 [Naganishia vaughanmartiniae]
MNRPTLFIDTAGHPVPPSQGNDNNIVPMSQPVHSDQHQVAPTSAAGSIQLQGQRSTPVEMKSFEFPGTEVSFTHAMVTPGRVEYMHDGFSFTAEGQPFLWTNPTTWKPSDKGKKHDATPDLQQPRSTSTFSNSFQHASHPTPISDNSSNLALSLRNSRAGVKDGPHDSTSGLYDPSWNWNHKRADTGGLDSYQNETFTSHLPTVIPPVSTNQVSVTREPSTTRTTLSLSPFSVKDPTQVWLGKASAAHPGQSQIRTLPHTSHGTSNVTQGRQDVHPDRLPLLKPSNPAGSDQGQTYTDAFEMQQDTLANVVKARSLQSTPFVGSAGGQIQPELQLAQYGKQYQVNASSVYNQLYRQSQHAVHSSTFPASVSDLGKERHDNSGQLHGQQIFPARRSVHYEHHVPHVVSPPQLQYPTMATPSYTPQPHHQSSIYQPPNGHNSKQQTISTAPAYRPSITTNSHGGTVPSAFNVPQVTPHAPGQQALVNSRHMPEPNILQRRDASLVDPGLQPAGINEWAAIHKKDSSNRLLTKAEIEQIASLRPSYLEPSQPPNASWSMASHEAHFRTDDDVQYFGSNLPSQDRGHRSRTSGLHRPEQTIGPEQHLSAWLTTKPRPIATLSGTLQPITSDMRNTSSDGAKKMKSKKRAVTSSDQGSKPKQRKLRHHASSNSAAAKSQATNQSLNPLSSLTQSSTQSSTGQSSLENVQKTLKKSRKRDLARNPETSFQPPQPAEPTIGHEPSVSDTQPTQALDDLQPKLLEQPAPSRDATAHPSTMRMCDQISRHGYDLRTGPRSSRFPQHTSNANVGKSGSQSSEGGSSESEE